MKKAIKILIVEDEAIQAMGLEETLQQAGYEIVGIADQGAEVLRYVQEEEVDLIIMDIHIKGDMDGIDAALLVRELRANMPIIYLTAFMDQQTVDRAMQTMPAAYITKPYRQSQLLHSIEQALGEKSS